MGRVRRCPPWQLYTLPYGELRDTRSCLLPYEHRAIVLLLEFMYIRRLRTNFFVRTKCWPRGLHGQFHRSTGSDSG